MTCPTWAVAFLGLVATCGGDDTFECKRPVDCATVPNATTCKKVDGHGTCVIDCASVNGRDNCPETFKCAGTADDGSTYCTPASSP